ncbi:MAG: hypothetical protein V9H69_03830 [Anaerolineae bacterium]|mgnify:CR=1 FL=1
MKPFTHWAIHHQQKVRIAGRDPIEVWGALVTADGVIRPFRYNQQTMRLTVGEGDDRRALQLDEYGFEERVEG